MNTTLLIAQLIGISSFAIGLSMLVRRKMVINIFDDVFGSRALTYVLGIAEVVAGLSIVLNHYDWTLVLPAVITSLGWLLILEGAIYMFAGSRTIKVLLKKLHDTNIYTLIALIYVIVGAYLTYFGFGGI